MNSGALVTTANRCKHLVSQPRQIRLQVAEYLRRCKVPRERLMPVQQALWVSRNYNIDGVKQSLQIAIFVERCPQIGHDDIPHEHHFFIGKIDQHAVWCFTSSNGNQLKLRSAYVQV